MRQESANPRSARKEGMWSLPHDGAHALADARVPAPGGVQREAAVGDVVRGCAVPSARHGYVLAMPSAEADAAQHQHCAATALDDNGCFLG
jgi:hypothetical protein